MFGIGFTEVLAVAVIALIFIGPEDLPKFARNIGRFLNELKRGSDSFVNEFKASTDISELNHLEDDIKNSLKENKSSPEVKTDE
jgi:sec-independent protein translocase protein TatB